MSRIRDRFGEEVFKKIFETVVKECIEKGLVKNGSIMMDGSLFKADASFNSLKRKDKKDEDDDRDGINKFRKKSLSNKTHVSSSDPDCTIAGKQGTPKKLSYKSHLSTDESSRVILDCHISTGSLHEVKFLSNRIEAIEENLNIKIKQVIADSGYGSK